MSGDVDPRVLDTLRAVEVSARRIAVSLDQLAALADEWLTRQRAAAEEEVRS